MKVIEIKKLSFTSLSLADKINIKNNERPTPKLNIVQVQPRYKNRPAFTRKFDQSVYDKILWLCGCEEKNAFFCFVCLLFGGDDNWTNEGICDLKHLSEKVKKHEKSVKHMNNLVSFQLLGKTNIAAPLSMAHSENIHRHNEIVLKNRYILSKIIDILKLCGKCNLALRDLNETNELTNKGVFSELVDYTKNIDSTLYMHFQKATTFKENSKAIQNELLDCMLQICRDYILNEVKQSSFVALMADNTTDVSTQAQMVLVLRYFSHGKIYERFWGFINPESQNAEYLSKCILEQINPILQRSPEKLIAQTYDGTVVMCGQVDGVNVKIKEIYRNAHFIYCYTHQLNKVLEQAMSDIPSVNIFFSNINAISVFFSNSLDRTSALNEVCDHKLSEIRWNFQSRAVQTVYQYKNNVLECFENIQSGNPKRFNNETILQAAGFIKWLKDDTFQFWLDFFNKLMPHIDLLFNQLQEILTDTEKIQHAIDNFQQIIKTIKDDILYIKEEAEEAKRRRLNTENLNLVASEVCDIINIQISERFAFRNHLSGVKLFQRENYMQYKKKLPLNDIDDFCNAFPMVDKQALIVELTIFYSRPEIAENEHITGCLQTLNFMISYDLDATFTEISKVLKILITMPIITTETERCFSTFKLIKSYLRNIMAEEKLAALAMLSTENDLMNIIPNFNEQVTEKFINDENRRMEFHLK